MRPRAPGRAVAMMTPVLAGTLLLAPSVSAANGDEDLSDGLTYTTRNFSRYVEPIRIEDERIRIDRSDRIRLPKPTPLKTETKDGSTSVVTLASDILFAFGKATVNEAAATQVRESLSGVAHGAAVSVGGHTDSIGDDASNLTLSQQRAQAVADLITAARPDLVLSVEGFGESKPVADNGTPPDNDNPEGRAQNRRVEIRYQG